MKSLFVCTGNTSRSFIDPELLEKHGTAQKADCTSAGQLPLTSLCPSILQIFPERSGVVFLRTEQHYNSKP